MKTEKRTRLLIQNRPESVLTSAIGDEGAYALDVRADYFEGQVDFKRFREKYPHYPVLSAVPLVIEPEKDSYAIITKFGGVVFWRCSDHIRRELLEEIKSLPGTLNRNEDLQDQITVWIGKPEDKVTFNEVWLRELTLENLKIISTVVGQSVALEHFENEVARVMERFQPVVEKLRHQGKLTMSHKQVIQAVGFALDVRAAVLANLTLFDDPPETWENENLAMLDSELYDQFDLEERLSAINQKVAYLTDINDTLMDLLNHRKSNNLEWIIIFLILFEIIFSLATEFRKLFP